MLLPVIWKSIAGIEIMNARRNLAKTLAQVVKETKA
jgi:uncharacterized protein YuzE